MIHIKEHTTHHIWLSPSNEPVKSERIIFGVIVNRNHPVGITHYNKSYSSTVNVRFYLLLKSIYSAQLWPVRHDKPNFHLLYVLEAEFRYMNEPVVPTNVFTNYLLFLSLGFTRYSIKIVRVRSTLLGSRCVITSWA